MDLLKEAVKTLVQQQKHPKEQPALPTMPDDDLNLALQDWQKEEDPVKKAKAFRAVLDLYKMQTSDD